jgi:hypothetical protein
MIRQRAGYEDVTEDLTEGGVSVGIILIEIEPVIGVEGISGRGESGERRGLRQAVADIVAGIGDR